MCVFFGSLLFSPFYIAGDQGGYAKAYLAQRGLDFADGWHAYGQSISAIERVHFLVIWTAAAFGMEKSYVMAFANALLAIIAMRVLKRWNVHFGLAVMIVLTNFYMLVLYFAAERLKFAFIFMGLSVLNLSRPRSFYGLVFVAIWSHVSVLFVYLGFFLLQGGE